MTKNLLNGIRVLLAIVMVISVCYLSYEMLAYMVNPDTTTREYNRLIGEGYSSYRAGYKSQEGLGLALFLGVPLIAAFHMAIFGLIESLLIRLTFKGSKSWVAQ